MIGPKKLSTIRKEIKAALASGGDDPIHRLDRQIALAKRRGASTEVVEGLKKFLRSPQKRRQPKQLTRAKTSAK